MAKEKASFDRPRRVVSERVNLQRIREGVGGIEEQSDVVADLRLPPNLRHRAGDAVDADVRNGRIAGGDQLQRIAALDRADGAVGSAVLRR